jgi:O-antigen ligase
LLAGLWVAGRKRPIVRLLAVPGLLLSGIIAWDLSRSQIVEYALRGGNQQGLETLNGRIPLWELAFDLIGEGGRWLIGFGYGSPRVLLLERVSWAGTAHNTWVELLMGVGLVGTAVAVIACLGIAGRLWTMGLAHSSRNDVIPFAIVVYMLVLSFAAELLAIPGMGLSMLAFLLMPAVTARWRETTHHHRESSTTTRRDLIRASS